MSATSLDLTCPHSASNSYQSPAPPGVFTEKSIEHPSYVAVRLPRQFSSGNQSIPRRISAIVLSKGQDQVPSIDVEIPPEYACSGFDAIPRVEYITAQETAEPEGLNLRHRHKLSKSTGSG